MRITILLAALALPFSAAADCPDPADVRDEMLQLFAKAKSAETPREGQQVSSEMWRVWLKAPDAAAQETLDAGMARREIFDFAGALTHFDALADYCPTYAEGFNQRAFVYYLQEDFEAALKDLDIALSLQPLHVGAQSGRALTLMHLGRIAEARDQMLIAVQNNPWLSESALLADGAPLGPIGKEL